MKLYPILLAVAGLQVATTSGQAAPREHIWSTVIYHTYGDRTPYILPVSSSLTALGANQMYDAGSTFRDRYLVESSSSRDTTILGISASELDNEQISILSLNQQFIVASAQAFMQGLYPPLRSSSDVASADGQSQLANGSSILFPLDGYQYPQITTASSLDLNSIWLSGSDKCPNLLQVNIGYLDSEKTQRLLNSTLDFYERLLPALPDLDSLSVSVNYLNAYLVYDYLRYVSIHKKSPTVNVTLEDLATAKSLANSMVSTLYGGISDSGRLASAAIFTVAGQTLARVILQGLYTNIGTLGSRGKMTLLFGGFEPIISFAALSQLATNQDSPFMGVPDYGSSMVFELFSISENDTESYPSTADLNVRFYFRNGTADGSELVDYPLFGNKPEKTTMSWKQFNEGMKTIMISGAGWCKLCGSRSIFCPALIEHQYDENDGTDSTLPESGHGPSRVVSGVIGALVSIAVFGILVAGVVVFGRVRFYRQKTDRRSDLTGFKGGEKLASDQDLTLPKQDVGGAFVAASTALTGQERIGSWELRDRKKAEEAQLPGLQSASVPPQRESLEQEDLHVTPYADPVKPLDQV